MITQRDLKVKDFICQYGAARTSTIEELFYKHDKHGKLNNASSRIAHYRLNELIDYKEVKRQRDCIRNEYIYYQSLSKQTKHKLLLTDFYRELNKIAKVVYFNNEKTIEHVRPDAIVGYEINNKKYVAFVEIEKSFKGIDLQKYKKLKLSEQYKKYFPVWPEIIIICNRNINSSIIEFIQIKEDLSNIKEALN